MIVKRVFLSVLLFAFIASSLFSSPKFALVLSGGGSRGLAHIPILEELDRRGLYPDLIVGTSMGALIGAFYAAGYSGEEIRTLVLENNLSELFNNYLLRGRNRRVKGSGARFIDNIAVIGFSPRDVGSSNGLISDAKISAFIKENLSAALSVKAFDDLPIPYRSVGTDIESGDRVIFSEGSFYDSIRGSISIPLVFNPVTLADGRNIVDGGLVDNIPVDVARAEGADVILAVDVNNTLVTENTDRDNIDSFSGIITAFLDMITYRLVEENYEDADFMLIPNARAFGVLDFGKVRQILEVGDECVSENEEAFDRLEEMLNGKREKRKSYSDLEPEVITSISYPGLEEYDSEFSAFIGRTFDRETAREFGKLLTFIRTDRSLMNINYEIDEEGKIDIKYEEYAKLPSAISIGFGLDLSGSYHINKNAFSFNFQPVFDLYVDMNVVDDGNLLIGLDIDHYSDILLGYYHSFLPDDSLSLFAELDIGVGSLSMLSKPMRIDRLDTTDFGVMFSLGLSYDIDDDLYLDLSFDLDMAVLGEVRGLLYGNDLSRSFHISPKATFRMTYDGFHGRGSNKYGAKAIFEGNIHMRSSLYYTLSFDLDSVIPTGLDAISVLFDANLFTSRSDALLGSSYAVSTSGHLTRDWISALLGLRIFFSEDLYMDIAFIAEGYEDPALHSQSRLWTFSDNLIPFALLSDYSLGAKVGVGYSTDFGDVLVYFGFDHHGALSLGVSFR